ncbi:DUF2992 family protein [Heliobacterium undosum]|uniref:DUF2992 family protein n=1 Tax=Heliomicrobium undosum TaxID=121734 RepID=A0A845L901_9FIRM|nr:YjdF family protein [Heliomicrobium undosum]MZP29401.1 DUF2992 family protein [Heliomicrobium undosum]
MKLTVFFDDPFWVGVIESIDEQCRLKAHRHLFGAEPKDGEVQAFVLGQMNSLLRGAAQEVEVEPLPEHPVNPKRLARQVARELADRGVSTKAQEALQRSFEARKKERQVVSRQQREAFKERKRELARLKAKAKRRGR